MMSLMCSGCREFSGGRGGKGRGADAGEAGRESTEAERNHDERVGSAKPGSREAGKRGGVPDKIRPESAVVRGSCALWGPSFEGDCRCVPISLQRRDL